MKTAERIFNLTTWFFVGVAIGAVLISLSACTVAPPMPPAVVDQPAVCAMQWPACDRVCCTE